MMFRSKALLLLAGLAVGCSGGDNNENSKTNNTQPDMSATADMGTNPNSGMPDMTVMPTPDMATPTPDMNQPPPTCEAFSAVYEYAYSEPEGAYYVADDSLEFPLTELSIELYEAPAAGSFELGDNYETCMHCVLIYADCDDTACAKTFLATSGTLELTEAGQEGERFTGTLTNAQFEEVTIDENNNFRSTPVAGGELSCIDSHPFDVYLGNICTTVGEECESDRSVEDAAFTCVDDGTGNVIGTCEMVPTLNLPALCTDTSFVGQIGGATIPDGGAYTDVAYTSDAGLQAVWDAIPVGADAVTDLSGAPLTVTGAIVSATDYDANSNWTFWVQDMNVGIQVRLTDAGGTEMPVAMDVRVGQAISFDVTSVETLGGHPRIKAIANFAIVSEGNDVYVMDRGDADITAADYGKIVRVGGDLGAPTACGGTAMCYPMTFGAAADKMTTLRSSSTFLAENDCAVYVGPVSGFPGPKDAAGITTLQLDTVNFDWLRVP